MEYEDLSWVLAALSIISTILMIHMKMIVGNILNLVASSCWSLYYYKIEQYSSMFLLCVFVSVYIYGTIKYMKIYFNRKPFRVDVGDDMESVEQHEV